MSGENAVVAAVLVVAMFCMLHVGSKHPGARAASDVARYSEVVK